MSYEEILNLYLDLNLSIQTSINLTVNQALPVAYNSIYQILNKPTILQQQKF